MLRLFLLLLLSATASASTSITFTRAEIDEMARLWETDSVAISDLANAQYPQFSGDCVEMDTVIADQNGRRKLPGASGENQIERQPRLAGA